MYDLSKLQKHGDDVFIADMVEIKRPHLMQIDSHVAIDAFFYCTIRMEIGSYCHISAHVSVIGGAGASVKMGDFSHLSTGSRLIALGDENLGYGLVSPLIPDQYRDKLVGGVIKIGNFASILTNAILSPGTQIGEGAVVAANSFVNKDIPVWEVWGGTPAKFLKYRDSHKMYEYAEKLGFSYDG